MPSFIPCWLTRRPNSSRRHVPRRPARPALEQLEERTVPVVAAVLFGTLQVQGGIFDSDITLRLKPGDPGKLQVHTQSLLNPDFTFDRANFSKISVIGRAGPDTITIDESKGVFTTTELTTIKGGLGDDVITGGSGNEVLEGGGGADFISGGKGNDTIDGGAGQDGLFGQDGNDRIDGGDNADEIFGGNGDDMLIGGGGPDLINGGAGNDVAFGGPGQDEVVGAEGEDGIVFYGTNGNDDIRVRRQVGPNGAQVVFELNGKTTVEDYREGETVFVYAGNGKDRVVMDESAGDFWRAEFYGENGKDELIGGNGDDLLDGGNGDDVLRGGGGVDELIGGRGKNLLQQDNVPPTFINRSVTALVDEGGLVTLTGTIVDPDPLDRFFLDVAWGDGVVETFTFGPGANGTTVNVFHHYADDADRPYTVTFSWRDQIDFGNVAALQVTVRNVGVKINELADVSLDLGTALKRAVTFTDPGADDWTATIDYGDGGPVQKLQLDKSGEAPLEHLYRRPGVYRVTVTVTDDDGGLDTATFLVTVL